MRTYSHALLTWAAARRLRPAEPGVAAWGAAGAVLPDLPALAGVVWFGVQRRWNFTRREFYEKACREGPYKELDAAVHSALPVAILLTLSRVSGAQERYRGRMLPAFLVGWAGHAVADALTHTEDARPILWPLSRRRFRGPISYWDRSDHARPLALVEHGTLLFLAAWLILRKLRALRRAGR